jgi:methionine-rich copper-binding protein CopC
MKLLTGRFLPGVIAVVLAVALAFTAMAHTKIEQATPASGAVLDRSPPTIEIKFKHAVRMTSVIVIDAAKAERKLAFEPTTKTQAIAIASPNLGHGRNELRWKALSEDGHVISGSLIYIVQGASP